MALDIGTLVGYLDIDGSKFDSKLDGAQSKMGKFGKFIGTAVVAGTVAAATAVTAFAAKGVMEFGTFQKGMNEVFTLLPGMSEEAMGELSDDTREFVREMGVAHDEAVPALYSALSAGVPRDNVFDFMEVAAKAAKGGVTDLNTAVDGISSVVNSYGDSLDGAAEASDLMFTAVRLGKTTFDELSASLFQVNPVASALGVGFEEVTASLAVMTAQGVPTSVATTQLRSALVELSQDGGKTSKTFEKLAGKTFKDFIAEGGNTGQALQMLADHAADTGVGVNDLFGSVEAGGAALALTGDNAAKFDSALGEMQSSAGATDAAFQQMDRGLSRSWEKITIGVTDAALGFGEKLAPAVADVSDWIGANLPGALSEAGAALDTVITFLKTEVPAAIDTVSGAVQGLITWFNEWRALIEVVAGVVTAVLLPVFVRMGVMALISGAQQVAGWVMGQVAAVKTAATYVIQTFVIIGRWIAMGAAAVASGAVTVAIWALYAAEAIKGAVVYGIQSAYVVAAWVAMSAAAVASGARTAAVWLGTVVASAASGAAAFLVSAGVVVGGWVLLGAQSLLHAARMAAAWFIAMGPVGWVIGAVVGLVALIVANWSSISRFTSEAWSNVTRFVATAWNNITSGVSNGINTVVSFVTGMPGRILGSLGNLGGLLLNAGGQIIEGFLRGLTAGFEEVKNFVGGIGQWIADNKGPKAYDLALLVPAGGWIMDGLDKGLKAGIPDLQKTLGKVSATIQAGIPGMTTTVAGTSSHGASGNAGAVRGGVTIGSQHFYEQSDPIATSMDLSRRLARFR